MVTCTSKIFQTKCGSTGPRIFSAWRFLPRWQCKLLQNRSTESEGTPECVRFVAKGRTRTYGAAESGVRFCDSVGSVWPITVAAALQRFYFLSRTVGADRTRADIWATIKQDDFVRQKQRYLHQVLLSLVVCFDFGLVQLTQLFSSFSHWAAEEESSDNALTRPVQSPHGGQAQTSLLSFVNSKGSPEMAIRIPAKRLNAADKTLAKIYWFCSLARQRGKCQVIADVDSHDPEARS